MRWHSSVRGWVFTLARNAMYQHLSSSRRFRSRHVLLADEPSALELPEVPAAARSESGSEEDVLQRLYAELSEGDARTLMMRTTLALSWEQIARSTLEGPEASSQAAVRREATRLRKRFQLIKQRLRRRATEICSQP